MLFRSAGQLKYLETAIYRVEYAELLGKQLFDVDESIPLGFVSGAYRSLDIRGKANWINGAAKDLPRADIATAETVFPIKTIGASFGYDVLEIEAARAVGMNLETERANAAAYIVETGIDEAIFAGVPDLGIFGLFTAPGIPNDQAALNGGGLSRTFADKTADEILADINGAFSRTAVDSKGRERPGKLILPVLQYNDIATRRLGTTSDTTVLEFIVSKSPYLRSMDDVRAVPYLTKAGTGGTDMFIIYDPNPVKVQVKLPLDTTIMTDLADVQGLEIVTPVIARFGGLVVRYPLSMRKVYGI